MKISEKTKNQENVSIVVNKGKILRRNNFLKRKVAKLEKEMSESNLLKPFFDLNSKIIASKDEISSNMVLLQLLDKYEDENKKVANSLNKTRKPKGVRNAKQRK